MDIIYTSNHHRNMEMRFLTTSLAHDFTVERNSKPVKRSYKDFLRGYGDYYANTIYNNNNNIDNDGDNSDGKRWKNVFTEMGDDQMVLNNYNNNNNNNITIHQMNQSENDYNNHNEMNIEDDNSKIDITNSRFTPKKCLEDYYFSSARFQPQPHSSTEEGANSSYSYNNSNSNSNRNCNSNCICSPEVRTGYSCQCKFNFNVNMNPDISINLEDKMMCSQSQEDTQDTNHTNQRNLMNQFMDSDMDVGCGAGIDANPNPIDSGWIIDHGCDRDEHEDVKEQGNKFNRPPVPPLSSSSSSCSLVQPAISSFFSKVPSNRQRSDSLKVSISNGSISSNGSYHSLIENEIPQQMTAYNIASNNSGNNNNLSYGNGHVQILRCRVCQQDSPSSRRDTWTSCSFCSKQVCVSCISSCERCRDEFCKFCITLNFSGAFSRPMCIDCDRLESTVTGKG